MDYLEGVGPELPYEGPAVPFIACPTTAGTGSEATKNAVLSTHGAQGFKKSFRDERLVPAYAVVDPRLLESCPPALIAANGMDAMTQLLESYVSTRANPLTDALCESGLAAVRDGLLPWYRGGAAAADGQDQMAYAALVSGVTLAQTGLGSVHGLAAPLGAFFPVPHGVACGTLVAAATALNVRAMREREPGNPALGKYARAAEILCGRAFADAEGARSALVELLRTWTGELALARLGRFAMAESEVPRVVANARGSSMKTNPIVLTDGEIAGLLRERL
jgi:alcohol dehydrogenase